MSDFAEGLLEQAAAVPDGKRRDWGQLGDKLTEGVVIAVRPFRLFLRCAADVGGVRPGSDFFQAYLGFGKTGAEALLSAYENALNDDPTAAASRMKEWAALAQVAREAKTLGLIDFDLNDWRPAQVDPAKQKVGIYLAVGTAERVRVAAFTARTTISAFIEGAVVAALERIEKQQGEPIEPRAEVGEAPGRRKVIATAASAH